MMRIMRHDVHAPLGPQLFLRRKLDIVVLCNAAARAWRVAAGLPLGDGLAVLL